MATLNISFPKKDDTATMIINFHHVLAKIVSGVYSVISLGFFCNVVVAIIVINILRQIGSKLPNRHVLLYVLALCIADGLVLGSLPLLIIQIYLQRWIFNQTLCTFYWIMDSINKTLSTFILTCLSFDRYLAVRYPHRCMKIRTVRGTVYILFGCVVFSAILLMPVYLNAELYYVEDIFEEENLPTCSFNGDASFIFTTFTICYLVPFACMSFFYGSMLARLRKRSKKLKLKQGRIRRVTMKTLMLVITYFLFWTPYWIMTLHQIAFYEEEDLVLQTQGNSSKNGNADLNNDSSIEANEVDGNEVPQTYTQAWTFVVMYTIHCLCYLNSAINPILSTLLNRELRRQHYAAMNKRNKKGEVMTTGIKRLSIESPYFATFANSSFIQIGHYQPLLNDKRNQFKENEKVNGNISMYEKIEADDAEVRRGYFELIKQQLNHSNEKLRNYAFHWKDAKILRSASHGSVEKCHEKKIITKSRSYF